MQPDEIIQKFSQASDLSSQGKYTESIECIAPYLSDDIEKKDLLTNMLYLLGHNYWKTGRYEEAKSSFSKAQTILKENSLYKKLPPVVNSLGLYQRKSGLYRDALIHFLEGLLYAFQFDDKRAMIAITANIGMVMMEMRDYDRSEKGYDAALRLCSQVPEYKDTNAFKCQILINKCLLSFYQGRTAEIKDILTNIQDIITQVDVEPHTHEIETFMAHSYVKIGEYEMAHELLKTKDIADSSFANVPYVINLLSMAAINKFLYHDIQLFLKYLDQALSISYEHDMYQTKLLAHEAFHTHFLDMGDTALAEFHEKKYKSIREEKRVDHEIGYLSSILQANIDAVEDKSRINEKISDLLSEHDFLINSYAFQYHRVNYQVPLRDIVYVEVQKNYLLIYTIANPDINRFEMVQVYTVRKTLKEFISEINTAASYFVRVHGSFIVNLYWISKFPQKNISRLAIGDKELPVSETYRSAFRDGLNAFLRDFPPTA